MKYMKSALPAVFGAAVLASGFPGVSAGSEAAAPEQEAQERDVFGIIKTAVSNNDRDLLLTAFRYPVALCINEKLEVYQNAEALKKYTVAEIIGSDSLVSSLVTSLQSQSSGEAFEISYDNYQVMGVGAYVTDREMVTINFTQQGIFAVNGTGCGGLKVPKLQFCGDPEQDALINMLALNSFWMFNSGTYENFRDHAYSRLEMIPGDTVAGGGYDFIFEGKKLNLVRDPGSFNSAPLFHDDSKEYMILAPAEPGEEYCSYPGVCHPVPFIHVFSKSRGASKCDSGEIVLAEKYTLNFCPFSPRFNAEIRLFTEGFSLEQPDLFKNSYRNGTGDMALSFEERKVTRGSGDNSYEENVNFAVLTFKGQKFETAYSLKHNMVFRNGDTEILAVPAGDYDRANQETENFRCAMEDQCVRPTERMLLFVRSGNGNCERYSLERQN
ncbi:hypothetical protein [Succinimonas amylolytica]|uniref:hypothetical protein n=1 Tax=Succinimonas amylolytica TaxID=83769 RepID=UPI00037BEA14|nr:hypothetical protein [Succinimonas amylolytica]